MVESPYANVPEYKWNEITTQLIDDFPLSMDYLVSVVLEAWDSIFETKIGKDQIMIGKDIFPKPQIMGFLLHELIPIIISKSNPEWHVDKKSSDKDIVYALNPHYSVEIKTSSNSKKIFGNRSYAQEANSSKKDKSGYYLAINFEKFNGMRQPKITLIRFGWIDHQDWIGQKAQSGQQSHLSPAVEKQKLATIYEIGQTRL